MLSGVSGKLNYLVVGKDAGSKLVKAKSIGTVKIITEKEFLKMVPKSKVTSSKKKKDVNEQSVEDAEIIEIFGELLQEHTADILNVPNDFYAICLGDTDLDDVLDLLTGDQEEEEDDDEWDGSGWGAYEDYIDFGFRHITNEAHCQELRDGVPYAHLAKHYSQEQILEDLDSLGDFVMIYCKQRGEKIYRIRTVNDLPKLFSRYPETLINVCSIGA